MNRRNILVLLGAAAVRPSSAWAQQRERMRRVGWLTASFAPDDPEIRARRAGFVEALRELGWTEGENIRIDYRSGAGKIDDIRKRAAELVALDDIVLANGSAAVSVLQQVSRTVPIVFVQVPDPVGAGFVESLAQPGGNVTGFTNFDYSIGGKWLELLKEIAPGVARVALLRDPRNPAGSGQWGAMQSAASAFGLELSPIDARTDAGDIERAIKAFARAPNGGLVMTASATFAAHRNLVIALAARHRLPAIYPYRYHVTSGGLISYGPDNIEQHRRAATYIDRILRGERPADLPVQAPTKYELVLNLKTARSLGLEVPPKLLVRADDVID